MRVNRSSKAGGQLFSLLIDILLPCQEGAVVVGSEIMPVLQDKEPFHCRAQLRHGGQHAAGENIFIEPGIAGRELC